MAASNQPTLQQQLQRMESLIQAIEAIDDPATRRVAHEAIQTLMDLHGAGLERVLEIVAEAGEAGEALIARFAHDELVGGLLLLYGLHPLDLETRVAQALETVRPYLRSHGGNVELLGISEGVVRLRLQGSCHGCPSSAMTLKLAIEEAIYAAAPDVVALEVEGLVERPPSPPADIIPLEPVAAAPQRTHPNGGGWEPVDLRSLAPGTVHPIAVAGRTVLFCRVGEMFYAYETTCPACGQRLDAARLEATALACPACGRRYDVQRAGRGLDDPSVHLEPFPLLIKDGRAQVALPDVLL